VVETKKGPLSVSDHPLKEDVIDQITDYLGQCRIKYAERLEYRGFIVGTRIANEEQFNIKLSSVGEKVVPLIFGRDIPSVIKICGNCHRAVSYETPRCFCGVSF
jgi:hypothetical protein